ncbi:hypothetical protein B0920_01575 [Massilia sp. KIM]|nr:hypothetical protein B0920_01575 [Massilia sp. KIM]
MSAARLAALALAMLGAHVAAQAATYTVGPGQSIQAAVNAAVAGDTVLVQAGIYTQKVLVSGKNGAAGAAITLKGEPGAIISGAGLRPSGREGLITVRNSSHFRVEGFTVTGFATGSAGDSPVGILVTGNGTRVQIVNNKIHGIKHLSTCADPCLVGAHGLAVFGTDTTGITDLLVQGNEVYGNLLQASEALVINGNVDRFEVLFNDVHDNNNIGYDFIGYEGECAACGENDRVRNGLVRGNRAANNSTINNPWYGGEGSAAGFYVDGGRNIVFERNIATLNDIGFEFASEHPGKATEDILMTNNLVYLNREAGVSLGGYAAGLGEARRIHVNNNSFYRNKGWGTEIVLQHKVLNSHFNNNIIVGATSVVDSVDNSGSGSSGNVWGVNLWFAPNTSNVAVPGARLVQDPRYVDPANGNLRLQAGSPAIGKGVAGAALGGWSSPLWSRHYRPGAIPANGSRDLDGQSRVEGGSLDLGADEFGTASPALCGAMGACS